MQSHKRGPRQIYLLYRFVFEHIRFTEKEVHLYTNHLLSSLNI